MAEAKGMHDWSIASNLMSLYINMNSKRKVSPRELNPYARREGKGDRMLTGKEAWEALRMMFSERKG